MGYALNSFPLVLKAQTDGSFETTVRGAEQFLTGGAKRSGDAWLEAGKRAEKAFSFDGARREVQQFSRELDSFRSRQASQKNDLFGIQDSLKNLSADPFNRIASEMLAAENRLAAQRAKSHAENMARIAAEAQAGINAVQQRQAAQATAFRLAEAEGLRLLQLDQQRIAESAKMVAGPQFLSTPAFNPAGFKAAAAAAEQFAQEQRALANAAQIAANAVDGATAEQRAFALATNQAANEAENEAARMGALARAHENVAAVAEKAGIKLASSTDQVTTSVRGQRFATIQASQQFQDFFIQIQGGQNPMVAFSQQASQLAFVMSSAGGAAGKFAMFMAGPWGTGIFAGLTVLSLLTSKLFENSDASKSAQKSTIDFTNTLESSRAFVNDYSNAIDQLSNATRGLINTQSILVDSLKATAGAQVDNLQSQLSTLDQQIATLQKTRRPVTGTFGLLDGNDVEIAKLQAQRAAIAANYEKAKASFAQAETAMEQRRATEAADPKLKARNDIQREIDQLTVRRNNTIAMGAVPLADQPTISQQDYERQVQALEAKKKALDAASSSAGSRIRTLNAQARLAAADDPTEKAQAELSLTKAINGELLRQGKITDATYLSRVKAAEVEVQRAEGLKRATAESAKAAREYQKLIDFGDRSAESIQRINERWNDQPRLIDSAAQDTRRLDAIVAELELRKPPGFKDLIAEAERTKKVVADGLIRPFNELLETQRQSADIIKLQVLGRQDEADALSEIQRLEKIMGPLSAERKQQILDGVVGLRQQSDELARQQKLWDIQISQARELQDAVTGFLTDPFKGDSLKNLAATITESRKRAIAQELSIKLFGDMGQDVEDRLRRGGDAVAAGGKDLSKSAESAKALHATAATALNDAATALKDAAATLRGSNDNAPTLGQLTTTPTAFGASGTSPQEVADIVVTAQRRTPASTTGLEPFLTDFSRDLKPIAVNLGRMSAGDKFDAALGRLETPLTYLSSAIGGKAGFAVDSILNTRSFKKMGDLITKELGGTLGKVAGGAVAGMGYGQATDSVLKALGMKGSSTGGSIGGAIGGAIGSVIPGVGTLLGGIIGGGLGSVVGGLLKKTPRAYVALGTDGNGNTTATKELAKGSGSSERLANAFSSADAVFGSLEQLASAFGTGLTFNLNLGSIGSRKGQYTFDPDRGGPLARQSFATVEEAVKAALVNAINKGVITGMRDSTKRLLTAGGDFEDALQKATTFENVFTELKGYTDPVGAAIDALDKQFASLRTIFAEAGASVEEYSQLEQLYAYKRADAVESASKDMTSTLQGFLDSLRYSGETGLSLGTRQKNARTAFDPLAAQIMAGQTVDQDKFTETAQSYLDIAREIYGSTQTYFDLLNQVTGLTAKAVENAGGSVTPITAAAQTAASTSGADITGATAAGVAANSAQAFTAASSETARAIEGQTVRLERKLDEKFDALAAAFDRFSASAPAGAPSPTLFGKLAALRNA
jgi:hypothetical protein